jgi:hypothetical protein
MARTAQRKTVYERVSGGGSFPEINRWTTRATATAEKNITKVRKVAVTGAVGQVPDSDLGKIGVAETGSFLFGVVIGLTEACGTEILLPRLFVGDHRS